jgi:hypothetical protein
MNTCEVYSKYQTYEMFMKIQNLMNLHVFSNKMGIC